MTGDQSSMQFFRQVFGRSWITQGYGLLRTRIGDLLAQGAADSSRSWPGNGRVRTAMLSIAYLRALASAAYRPDELGRFALMPIGNILRSDVPGSQRAFSIMMGPSSYNLG